LLNPPHDVLVQGGDVVVFANVYRKVVELQRWTFRPPLYPSEPPVSVMRSRMVMKGREVIMLRDT